MLPLEVPRFPRGFLISKRPVEAPPTYVPGPIISNFYVHPWATLEVAGDEELFVIVIGQCVPTSSDQHVHSAQALLTALQIGRCEFIRALENYSGRHAIIFGSRDNINVVNDATAMRSVFYAEDGEVVASRALLVEQALGGEFNENDLPFQYGYPGNRTPYMRTRTLTANTYYSMRDNLVHRFWPIAGISPKTVDQAATARLEKSVFALQTVAKDRQVRLTLTAGLDSRAILALSLQSDVLFETSTYGDNHTTEVDRAVAEDLAAQFSLKHTVISSRSTNVELKKRLIESNYSSHHGIWVDALRNYYQDIHDLAVLGNGLEIGRSNSMSFRKHKDSLPTTAEAMAKLHFRRMTSKRREQIQKAGVEEYLKMSESAFRDFIIHTSFDSAATLVDPFDLFYWEYRMSAWQGQAMNERDFYGESFIAFNIRSVLASMLGVPEKERYEDAVVYRMIEMVDPRILELPINPPRWPTMVASNPAR